MRIMALDIGTKRIGVALSDELCIIARPLEIIEARSIEDTIKRIKELFEINKVGILVLGMPINMDGTLGPKAEEARNFGQKLNMTLGIEVEYFDERLSTVQANNLLIEADISRKKRKGITDKLAAQFILQGYLDMKKSRKND